MKAVPPGAWVVAEGPRAARWERLWTFVGLAPRRAARLEDVAPGRGVVLADVASLRPDPGTALAALRGRGKGLAVVACTGPGTPPDQPAAALAGGALDLFAEGDPDESLAARLKAHIKRLFPRAAAPGSASTENLRLDLRAREVRARRGKSWRLVGALTAREFDVLSALTLAQGRPLSREELLGVIGHDGSPEAVDKTVGALRRKLGPAGRSIKTERGAGYRVG